MFRKGQFSDNCCFVCTLMTLVTHFIEVGRGKFDDLQICVQVTKADLTDEGIRLIEQAAEAVLYWATWAFFGHECTIFWHGRKFRGCTRFDTYMEIDALMWLKRSTTEFFGAFVSSDGSPLRLYVCNFQHHKNNKIGCKCCEAHVRGRFQVSDGMRRSPFTEKGWAGSVFLLERSTSWCCYHISHCEYAHQNI